MHCVSQERELAPQNWTGRYVVEVLNVLHCVTPALGDDHLTPSFSPPSTFGERDGLQMMQQEQQNKRVIEERRSLVSIAPQMRAMMEECMKKTVTK